MDDDDELPTGCGCIVTLAMCMIFGCVVWGWGGAQLPTTILNFLATIKVWLVNLISCHTWMIDIHPAILIAVTGIIFYCVGWLVRDRSKSLNRQA